MDFISVNENTYGKMAINIDNVVSFAYVEHPDGLMTRIDTVIPGNPLYVKGDITKDLVYLIRARGGSYTHLG